MLSAKTAEVKLNCKTIMLPVTPFGKIHTPPVGAIGLRWAPFQAWDLHVCLMLATRLNGECPLEVTVSASLPQSVFRFVEYISLP